MTNMLHGGDMVESHTAVPPFRSFYIGGGSGLVAAPAAPGDLDKDCRLLWGPWEPGPPSSFFSALGEGYLGSWFGMLPPHWDLPCLHPGMDRLHPFWPHTMVGRSLPGRSSWDPARTLSVTIKMGQASMAFNSGHLQASVFCAPACAGSIALRD